MKTQYSHLQPFFVSKTDIERVCKYVLSQPEHLKKVIFSDEYEEAIKYYQDTLKNKANKVNANVL